MREEGAGLATNQTLFPARMPDFYRSGIELRFSLGGWSESRQGRKGEVPRILSKALGARLPGGLLEQGFRE